MKKKKINKKKKVVIKKVKKNNQKIKKSIKKVKKISKKIIKKTVIKKLSSLEKKTEILNKFANELIEKGRKRGFITYDEILKTFPDIENNILFLDELYEKFSVAGIDVLEGGNLLNLDLNVNDKDLTKFYIFISPHFCHEYQWDNLHNNWDDHSNCFKVCWR